MVKGAPRFKVPHSPLHIIHQRPLCLWSYIYMLYILDLGLSLADVSFATALCIQKSSFISGVVYFCSTHMWPLTCPGRKAKREMPLGKRSSMTLQVTLALLRTIKNKQAIYLIYFHRKVYPSLWANTSALLNLVYNSIPVRQDAFPIIVSTIAWSSAEENGVTHGHGNDSVLLLAPTFSASNWRTALCLSETEHCRGVKRF